MANRDGVVDFLVIGGGTAGIVGAMTAAGFGASTVLVERDRTGGDCLWTGCVPSKTIISAAALVKTRRSPGLNPADRAANGSADFAGVRERIARAIATIEPADSPAALETAGVEVITGNAAFTGPGKAEVGGRTIRFRQALIAVGAAPARPAIPGLRAASVLTPETIWDLETLPDSLTVIGGGPVACELGQAFARLGSEVRMIIRTRLLPKEDADAAAIVRQSLEADGVHIREQSTVTGAENSTGGVRLFLNNGTSIDAGTILFAAGRIPRTAGLGLDRIGVDLDERGQVLTDARMRTSNPLVWAAGDVTANPRFTHVAGVHASTAATNAVLGLNRRVSAVVPRVTYTSPELAAVGSSQTDHPRHRTRTVTHRHVDRAVTDERTEGFTRLTLGGRGKILGGTIVGPRAGESLAELTLAVQKGLTTADIAGTTHAYPTYSDGVWNAAIADVRTRTTAGPARLAVKTLAFLRRRRVGRPPVRAKRPERSADGIR
ncbi:dihydrolipoyl dehydrogenase family protein [Arthrobacter bambusae]|uniref:dihydrolipoyl dehydrogenase family protein n=1 Tax=Arthrobacter bambusae TaxID=1338426 RepID=UPI002780F81C|nr:FAD-dependent oxidoreductase [Arthrobacter bambusae]MDQ0213118.1 pyruvate/2-oxoglutarate dehydrogenase complex dihydrolipoamide dehydrogenase (E3) component [Arthrobacter bambusae]MDQ0237432.1 pyruvate/2-oxoglutarate dehydrogenase complex dihydrolipoamide dehydrogenase (E3) component [Arthrobacter bambusae]